MGVQKGGGFIFLQSLLVFISCPVRITRLLVKLREQEMIVRVAFWTRWIKVLCGEARRVSRWRKRAQKKK